MPELIKPLNALTGLRFVAASVVVVHHAHGRFGIPRIEFPLGAQAVSFFFVLSGFILAYVYHERIQRPGSLRRFWVTRFARIWPLHFFCFLISLFLIQGAARYTRTLEGWGQLVANAALMQSWVPSYQWAFSVNGVSWSISNELFFYAMFPLLLWGGSQFFWRKYAGIATTTLVSLMVLHFCFKSGLRADWFSYVTFVHINPAMRLLEFATGVGVGLCFIRVEKLPRRGGGLRDFLYEISAIGLVALTCWVIYSGVVNQWLNRHGANSEVTETWLRVSAPAMVFAWIIFVFARSRGPVAWLLSRRPLVFLGEISFSLYMIHFIVILFFAKMYPGPFEPNAWLSLAGILGSSIGLSALLYRFVEIPSRDWIVNLYDGRARQGTIDALVGMGRGLSSPAVAIAGLAMVAMGLVMHINCQLPKSVFAIRIMEIMAHSDLPAGPIKFGEDITLYGAQSEFTEQGLRLKTVWRGGTPSSRMRFLHICNENDEILRHARQTKVNRKLRDANEVWLDEVLIPYEDLRDATKIGIGFHSKDQGMVIVNKGTRSLKNYRLDFLLSPEATQTASKRTDGSAPTILR